MKLILRDPCVITPRLLPGLAINGGKDWISIAYGGFNAEGRMNYKVWIDIDGKSYLIDDLSSGVEGGTLEDGLASLLSFLGAAAEAYRYNMQGRHESDNSDLFHPDVMEWAYMHDSEIGMFQMWLGDEPHETYIQEIEDDSERLTATTIPTTWTPK